MRSPSSLRGFSRPDVLATLVAGAVLVAIASVGLGSDGHGARTQARSAKDGRNARLLVQSLVVFSNEFGKQYPRPGLIDRRPDPTIGRDIPGRGPEDPAQNTTANLYSALIMQNYVSPEMVVSPVERNPRVSVAAGYDFTRYDPANDQYWDPSFVADLGTASHASYAHLPMFGARMEQQWRQTADAGFAVLGNRGPRAGERDGASYTCGPHGHWAGHLAFNDGHVELRTTMALERTVAVGGVDQPDNAFAMETGPAGDDVVVTFTLVADEKAPKLQYD